MEDAIMEIAANATQMRLAYHALLLLMLEAQYLHL